MTNLPKFSTVTRAKIGVRNGFSGDSTFALHSPEVVGAFADGTLPRAMADAPLEVNIKWWDGVQADMRLRLMWNGTDIEPPFIVLPEHVADPTFVFSLTLPLENMAGPDAVNRLSFNSRTFPGGVTEEGTAIPIIVDRTAPGGDEIGALNFPDEYFLNGVTAEDLVGGMLEGEVPDWFGMAEGDIITPWLGKGLDNPVGNLLLDAAITITADQVGQSVTLGFPQLDLETFGDGYLTFSYDLTDKAGNRSVIRARNVPITVLIKDAPEDVLPPLIPAFDDGLVTDADARVPVEVQIPQYTNALAGDNIIVLWGDQTALPAVLSDTDIINDPMIGVLIPYALIAAAQNGPINVSYKIQRGIVLANTSPPTAVVVDLSIPGGPDPDPETPENENLNKLVAKGASGTENEIPPSDYTQEASVTIPWLTVDGNPAMATNDIVQVVWGAENLPPYAVKSTDSADLLLPVPVAIMTATGTGLIPVHYTISHSLSFPPHIGASIAPTQDVKVVSSGDLPGGTGGLGLGDFIEKNVDNALSRDDLETPLGSGNYHGTPFRISNYVNINVDDHIELFFLGYEKYDGTGAAIEASRFEPTYDIVQADIDRGYYEFVIPAKNLFTICTVGVAKASYKVTAKVSQLAATSLDATVLIDVKMPSEPTCPVIP